jgi:hypothetical protein
MCRFEIINILGENTPLIFYKLEIKGKCGYDDFTDRYKRSHKAHINNIEQNIDWLSEGNNPIITRFKPLKRPKPDKYIDYEFIAGELRLYCFEDKGTGRIIVIGGFKKEQKKQIKTMRRIKTQYFQAIDDNKTIIGRGI